MAWIGIRFIAGFLAPIVSFASSQSYAFERSIEQSKCLAKSVDTVSNFYGIIAIGKSGKVVESWSRKSPLHDVPLRVNSRFPIGSISKQFTAALLMDMVAKKEIKLDGSFALPNGKQCVPSIREILTHTAGIPRDALGFVLSSSLAHRGGFDYSNLGYEILARISVEMLGQPFAKLLKDRVFSKAGLQNTSLIPLTETKMKIGNADIEEYLKPFSVVDGTPKQLNRVDASYSIASGGVVSTAEDLIHWNDQLFTYRIVPKEETILMSSQQVTTHADEAERKGYGFGLYVGDISLKKEPSERIRIVHHAGYLNGYTSWLGYLPDSRVTVVVLSNSDIGSGIRSVALHALSCAEGL